MRTLLILSVAAFGLTACGGSKTVSSLKASCNTMAEMAGETPEKGQCDCMATTLVENLSKEQATKVADAFSKMKKPEDAMIAMMPLLADGEIMKALGAVETKCDMK